MKKNKLKMTLGFISVIVIMVLIITNSILFKLYVYELRQNENATFNISSLDDKERGLMVRQFIIDNCRVIDDSYNTIKIMKNMSCFIAEGEILDMTLKGKLENTNSFN